MRINGQRVIVCLALLLMLGVGSPAPAQVTTYSAVTEIQQSHRVPARVTQTRVEANGRTIETRVVEAPSINGGYALLTATETETIHDGPNSVRVVERSYLPDPDGRRRLFRTTEAETRTVDGKSKTTTRTWYDRDWDGHTQAMERETEESVPLSASTNQTVSTDTRLRGGVLTPVQRTVTVDTRNENGASDVRRTVSFPDSSGKFIAAEETRRVEDTADESGVKTTEEAVLRADNGRVLGEGQLSTVQRTVTQEWKDSDGQHSVASTYSKFTPGIASDGELHLNRQVAAVQQVAANGDTQVLQETAETNPGARTDPPRPQLKIIEITHYGPGGQFETKTITEAPGSSGSMEPVATSNTRGSNSGTD